MSRLRREQACLPDLLVKTQVIDLGLRSVLALEDADPLGHDYLCRGVIGVSDIADQPRPERTGADAGRLQPLVDSVVAEVALLRNVVDGMEEPHAVGTSHDAVTAPDTPGPVDE